jgi:hypothetical protein
MLEERLNEDMKNSLKTGRQDRLQTLRMMRSQILLEKKKDASIDLLPDPQVVQTLTSYAKKLRESAAEYEKLGQKEARGRSGIHSSPAHPRGDTRARARCDPRSRRDVVQGFRPRHERSHDPRPRAR